MYIIVVFCWAHTDVWYVQEAKELKEAADLAQEQLYVAQQVICLW